MNKYLIFAFKIGSYGNNLGSGYISSRYSNIAILSIKILLSDNYNVGTAY